MRSWTILSKVILIPFLVFFVGIYFFYEYKFTDLKNIYYQQNSKEIAANIENILFASKLTNQEKLSIIKKAFINNQVKLITNNNIDLLSSNSPIKHKHYFQYDHKPQNNSLDVTEIKIFLNRNNEFSYNNLYYSQFFLIFLTSFIFLLFVNYIMHYDWEKIVYYMSDIVNNNDKKPVVKSYFFANIIPYLKKIADNIDDSKTTIIKNEEQASNDLRKSLATIELQNIELKIARSEAEKATKIKSEFLANMSHELRTPLHGIIGFINLIKKTKLEPEQIEYINNLDRSANLLLSIINDILDFSKLEAKKLQLSETEIDLRQVIEDTISMIAPISHEKNIELVPFVYDDVPTIIKSDAIRIKQVISNLVSNALKFTAKGSVIIRVMLEQKIKNNVSIKVSISDTGIGMTQIEQENLFKSFSQANTGTTRKYGGTGLGLVICKKIVANMGGKIGFISKENKGSTFWFTFKAIYSEEHSENNYKNQIKGKTIILYEKHNVSMLMFNHLLTYLGANVINCSSNKDIFMHEDKNIDMVLYSCQDLQIPKISELIKKIKKTFNAQAGVLVNSTDYKIHTAIFSQGADLCMSKPIYRTKFYSEICEILLKPGLAKAQINPNKVITAIAVDDNENNLKIIAAMLEELGISVVKCRSGNEAIISVNRNICDFILMDIDMPVMDGFETTKKIRNLRGKLSKLPIIALSAHSKNTTYNKKDLKYFDDWLIKPVHDYELRAIINKWVTLKEKFSNDPPISTTPNSKTLNLEKEVLSELPDYKTTINTLYKQNKFKDLKDFAHKIRGSVVYTSFDKLLKDLKDIEYSCNHNNLEKINKKLTDFNKHCDELI